MATTLNNAQIFAPTETIKRGSVVVNDDGRIEYVGPMEEAPVRPGRHLDVDGFIVAPGLIDIHVHGGHGVTFGNSVTLEEDLLAYSGWVVENGVTGFLTTIAAPTAKELVETIRAMVSVFEKGLPGAEALGIHLEGPFLSLEQKGAQNPEWIHIPTLAEAQSYVQAGKGWIKQITMAPELPRAVEVAALLRSAGVVVAIGHSSADYDTARGALEGDWTHVTHTFNAQTGLHHRKPGVVGAILASDEISAELIADTVHVHPGAMRVLIRCLGTDRVVLVTDAMAGAGLPDGDYELLGFPIKVHGGKATQSDGTIAGSTAVLNRCVENVNKKVGVPLADAIKMATLNPARVIGASATLGRLQSGKEANLVVINENLDVRLTMVKGDIMLDRM
jgi:N-acetylglucosamine-6-phosphate deacetylase